jgi:uncharacterized protein GlcG (DUF336 family)
VKNISVTRPQPVITLTAADAVVAAGLRRAAEMGVPQVVAVVDPGAALVALSRQDGAPVVAIDLAIRKAQTAAAVGKDTQELWDFIHEDPELVTGLAGDDSMLAVGGGVVLRHNGAIVGAVGVSGGYYREDIEVAEAARDELGRL